MAAKQTLTGRFLPRPKVMMIRLLIFLFTPPLLLAASLAVAPPVTLFGPT